MYHSVCVIQLWASFCDIYIPANNVLPFTNTPPSPLPMADQCNSASVSAITLHDTVVKALRGDGPVHHMILGPACTVATEPVAEFSGKYINVNQVCRCVRVCAHVGVGVGMSST